MQPSIENRIPVFSPRFFALFALVFVPALAPAAGSKRTSLRVGENVMVSVDHDAVQVEPHLAVDPIHPRNMVIAAIKLPVQADVPFGGTITAFNSNNGGDSWVSRDLPRASGPTCYADPWLAWGKGDNVYLSCLARSTRGEIEILLYRSMDRGDSWVAPTEVTVSGSFDHPIVLAAPGMSRLEDRVEIVAVGSETGAISILESLDGGQRFSKTLRYFPDQLNNILGGAVLSTSRAPVFSYYPMSFSEKRPLWAVWVSKAGDNFSRSLIVPDETPIGFPALAVDTSSHHRGRLFAVWLEENTPSRLRAETETRLGGLDVLISYSSDNGQTWSKGRVVNRPSSRTVFRAAPQIAVGSDGIVALSWNDRSGDPDNRCSDQFFTVSTDGGTTFLPEVRVSTTTSCHELPGNGADVAHRWPMGGDYTGLAPLSPGRFELTWADSRKGKFQIWAATLTIK